ncbi:recombinase RecT [Paenibacillus sp. F411]|uniref:RecT family recombinase n=1 Tax=Paenibacillus sp. F411 TaxID=2820239 RepID=UPI001AAF711C|nr:RecT family recombinase [Paenibacillus sp. F411]MBO2943620.1 recombinase RecT [Paenibacillus sp. F411]
MANPKAQLMTLTPEIKEAFPVEVLEVIRTSLCPTASDPEFLLFAHKAASYRLDPFKNEIFFIKYGNQARIQFAAEAYLSKAREKEGFQPPDTQMVCENDEFKIAKNPETKEMEVVLHEIGFPRGKIIGAYSIAYRDDYRPVTVIMDRSEIEHMFSGQNKENWNKWTTDMFGKHVEQRALKKQYGLEFGDEDLERPPAENVSPYERKDITPASEKNVDEDSQQTTKEDESTARIDALKAQVKANYKKLGITSQEARNDHMQLYLKMKGDAPTEAEIKAYLKIMDMEIQEKQAADQAADSLPE